MKILKSPFTVKFLKRAWNEYEETGLFWGALTLLSSSFVATNDKWLLMKIGNSGAGKTISDKVAIESFGSRLHPLSISGRLTPAGIAKVMKKAEKDSKMEEELNTFRKAKLIFVEDLSRCTTHYLKLTSLQFLAGLTRTTSLDDLTSEGGLVGGDLGTEPKKAMVAGTPSDWEEIASTSLYLEFIDRRSLTAIALMSPKEWRKREDLAKRSFQRQQDWQIILAWKDMIRNIDLTPYYGPMADWKIGPSRFKVYDKLSSFKRYPENLLSMIDSLAEGHARLNGRDQVLPEDFEVVEKLFTRFLVLADMKKKELFIVEELVRSHGALTENELCYRLRQRARREDLPDIEIVNRTIRNYVYASKYLQKNRACQGKPSLILLSPLLHSLFANWEKEVKEMINVPSKSLYQSSPEEDNS